MIALRCHSSWSGTDALSYDCRVCAWRVYSPLRFIQFMLSYETEFLLCFRSFFERCIECAASINQTKILNCTREFLGVSSIALNFNSNSLVCDFMFTVWLMIERSAPLPMNRLRTNLFIDCDQKSNCFIICRLMFWNQSDDRGFIDQFLNLQWWTTEKQTPCD